MKILHLISGGDVGGAKTHVLSLLQGLGKTETARLVCFTDGEFAADARRMGIDTVILHRKLPQTVKTLAEMISGEGFQLVHCHGARANLIGAILRRKIRVPTVTTVHSDYRLDYLGRPFHRLTFGTINTIALRFFDYHIGVSDSMAQLLISRGFDPQTMFSIYNGIDFTPITPKLTRDEYFKSVGLAAQPDSVVFGIAARFSAVKDVATLIRAFARAVKEAPSIRLLIAGDGEERPMLENLAASSCPPGSVVFAGWVTDMDSFYNAIDVNGLTSLSETFPYALTEGARMHCATVASNVGGVPYLIEPGITGLLFEPKDDETLAGHILRLAQNPAFRRQLGENLYEKASTKFSIEATVAAQKKIYETILRRAARPKQKRSGVVICGAYGKGNAGDEAILKAILLQMRELDADMPLYVLSHNPMQTRLQYHVGAVHAFNPFAFLPLMRKAKLYLNGGGSLIQDQTSTRSLKYYLLSIALAHQLGCRVVMYGCGIGPVNGKGNRRHAARVIDRCVDAITLREDLSAEELKSMGVKRPKVYMTADPALLLEAGSPGAVDSFLLSQNLDPNGQYALFVLRPWKGFDERKKAFVASANYVNKEYGLTPVFFALEPGRDLAPSREVAEELSCKSVIVPAPQDEKLIIGMMKKMRVVVSMRLHTLIFASSVGAPLVAVSYDPKVTGYMNYLGQKHTVRFEDVTPENLTGLVHDALTDHEPYRVEHLRELARENEDVARALLEETK
jgi:polysaccharide pyruvyl transferase CsaB